jgi:hypothetical protein
MNPLEFFRSHGEGLLMGTLAMGVASGAAWLIVFDLLNSEPHRKGRPPTAVSPPAMSAQAAAPEGPNAAAQTTSSPQIPAASDKPSGTSAKEEGKSKPENDVTDYLTYHHTSMTLDGNEVVVTTGWRHASSSGPVVEQFCYIMPGKFSDNVGTVVHLAKKKETAEIQEARLDARDAKVTGLSLEALKEARSGCKFK